MKRMLMVLGLLVSMSSYAGRVDGGAVLGGAIGGATGAAIGSAVGGRDGAVVGGAIGAAIGSHSGYSGDDYDRRRQVVYSDPYYRPAPEYYVVERPVPVYVVPRYQKHYGPKAHYRYDRHPHRGRGHGHRHHHH